MQPIKETGNARHVLRWAALFLGELRDGLTMINMQSAFLMVSKNYREKQAGILFFAFGMSQFLFQTPAGYIMDYSEKKIIWLAFAGIVTTVLTLVTVLYAQDEGGNLGLMIFVKILQGAITSLIPPGLNSISQGIVGAVGMTKQVSMNEMMNHLGTAIMVLVGSIIVFGLYPDIGYLFIVSPIACSAFLYNILRIDPADIDHNAARGLTLESNSQVPETPTLHGGIQTNPIANFKGKSTAVDNDQSLEANSPLQILRDPVLLLFIALCFLFHLSNGTVLPLTMQSLAIGNGRSGILLSGLCIIVAQIFMVMSAKICGAYSKIYGRKRLFLIGFVSVPVRCLILTWLIGIREATGGSGFLQVCILSTQILDGAGAGIFGTMYILVTSDISGGTGRFSLTLGLTTAAMSIGGTVSGYLGQALAEDLGYQRAFLILAIVSCVPFVLYLFLMPETLPGGVKERTEAVEQAMSIVEEEGRANEGRNNNNKNWTEHGNGKTEANYVEMS